MFNVRLLPAARRTRAGASASRSRSWRRWARAWASCSPPASAPTASAGHRWSPSAATTDCISTGGVLPLELSTKYFRNIFTHFLLVACWKQLLPTRRRPWCGPSPHVVKTSAKFCWHLYLPRLINIIRAEIILLLLFKCHSTWLVNFIKFQHSTFLFSSSRFFNSYASKSLSACFWE